MENMTGSSLSDVMVQLKMSGGQRMKGQHGKGGLWGGTIEIWGTP